MKVKQERVWDMHGGQRTTKSHRLGGVSAVSIDLGTV